MGRKADCSAPLPRDLFTVGALGRRRQGERWKEAAEASAGSLKRKGHKGEETNVIEQDHRRVKQRVRRMLGCKRFDHAALTVSGIQFAHQIKKDQFDISTFCPPHTRTPSMWESVLAI